MHLQQQPKKPGLRVYKQKPYKHMFVDLKR